MPSVPAISIEILDGLLKGEIIKLEGRAMPYKGVGWETEQRIKTTYYPGNPVATQQVFGPIEKNTIFTGMWKDRFLGNGMARALVNTFRDLVRTASPVEVTWGMGVAEYEIQGITGPILTIGNSIIRRGLVKRISPKFDRAQDINWEMEFEWSGADDPISAIVISAGHIDLKVAQSGLWEWLNSLRNWIAAIGRLIAAAVDFLSDILRIVDVMLSIVDVALKAIGSIMDAVATLVSLPGELIERGLEVCDSIVRLCEKARYLFDTSAGLWIPTKVGSSPPILEDASRDWDRIGKRLDVAFSPTDDPSKRLQAVVSTQNVAAVNDATAAFFAALRAQFESQKQTDIIKVVRVSAGSSLRDLSLQVYGTPELWWAIADANGFDGQIVPEVPDGPSDQPVRPISIPRKPTQAELQRAGF